jgi:hypothetical protein
LHAVSEISTSLADRLAHILNRYDKLVDVMTAQPLTLVHGSYRPQNILVNLDSASPRVCPTDWELAALGAPLYDLAFLSDGFAPPILDRLWNAYREGTGGCTISLPDREEMRYIVDCFRLHKIIKSLSESLESSIPESTVAKIVGLGERLSILILGQPGSAYFLPRRARSEISDATAEGHPAARAWQELQPGQVESDSIVTSKQGTKSYVE